jgi:hypothetical protein
MSYNNDLNAEEKELVSILKKIIMGYRSVLKREPDAVEWGAIKDRCIEKLSENIYIYSGPKEDIWEDYERSNKRYTCSMEHIERYISEAMK